MQLPNMDGFLIQVYILLAWSILVSARIVPFTSDLEESHLDDFDRIDAISKNNKHTVLKKTESLSQDEDLPWACGMEYVWRDLGPYHYPRHVRDVVCTNSSCWYGHYACAPLTYNIKVLTPNLPSSLQRDGKLPASLRQGWLFRDIGVTVGCQCSA